ncbi:variable surface protein Vir24-related [Plasmodium vivax]|uniref:Variable surface protein Vir24-related n=1 Tax=Plasmodium vivax (strain Salvador I) TaxID=126793 RepID=A5KCR4_PLAVS|nr:variable surface protein Vir24-related [Plasmodium vivax]EDL42855.1 variable surface protein Vir24-related [Plasmodium vivax]|eukprot:XP_001612629.1 variable surface protein Vir24-related [Plasmodium vivax Sal-1]
MKKFNNRDYDMKNLCKRIAWNLENLYNILPYRDSKVRCSYFNHWIYNEIRKLLVTEYNFKKDESAVFKLLDLGSDMNRNLRINSKIVSDYDKCNLYSKYIKYILKIYDTHKYDCCDSDWPYDSDCPKYFKCHGYYNPESLLSLLRCNDTSLGAHVLERVPEEPKFREESRERFRPQIENRSGSFPDIEVREIKENGFQNPVVPEIMRVKGPQFPTEAALRRRLDTSRSEVDGSEGNLGSRNRRLMQTTRAPSQEYLGEGIRKEVDYKPAVTEITHVQYTEKEDEKVTSEGGISYQLTSGPYKTEDRGTFSAYNGESEIYTSGGGSYTEMSEYGGDEHTTSGGFSSHFSNILESLKNNVYTVSIGSVASAGFLYFFYNYFKVITKYLLQYKKFTFRKYLLL